MAITKFLDEKARKAMVGDTWPIRRRWMLWTLLFLSSNIEALIVWTIFTGGNALGVQIIMALLGGAMAVIMAYVFGAIWDDDSKRKFLRDLGRPRDEESCDDAPVPGDKE